MKSIRADLSENFKELELIAFSDWHWSDPHSNHETIKRDIDYVLNKDNAFCVLNGDLMDCAIASSVGDTYGAILSPMDELQVCVDLFKPLVERGKVLCVLKGNHEARHYRTNGIDVTALMCQQLGIADRYAPDTALIFIRFGRLDGKQRSHGRKAAYTVYVSHGNGGGRKEGGKIQRLVDLATIVDADVYICGHSHLPASLKDGFIRPCMANSSLTYGKRLFVNTSAKLNYGGYGEVGGYKVPCIDTPIILLNGTKKDMRALI